MVAAWGAIAGCVGGITACLASMKHCLWFWQYESDALSQWFGASLCNICL